jgi:hypothetical protein
VRFAQSYLWLSRALATGIKVMALHQLQATPDVNILDMVFD